MNFTVACVVAFALLLVACAVDEQDSRTAYTESLQYKKVDNTDAISDSVHDLLNLQYTRVNSINSLPEWLKKAMLANYSSYYLFDSLMEETKREIVGDDTVFAFTFPIFTRVKSCYIGDSISMIFCVKSSVYSETQVHFFDNSKQKIVSKIGVSVSESNLETLLRRMEFAEVEAYIAN